jgi:hypothetical protein
MKNLPFLVFTLLCVLIFSSCKKETNLTPNSLFNIPPSLPPNFQADLNGAAFNFNILTSIESNGFLNIEGVKDSIKLTIVTSSTSPGTYKSEYNGVNNVNLSVYEGVKRTYSSAFVPIPNMEIIISSFDAATNTISGTFSGIIQDIDTQDSIQVTNGKFTNLKLTEGSGFNLGSLSAKLDAVPYDANYCFQTATKRGQIIKQITGPKSKTNESIKILFLKQMKLGTFLFNGVDFKLQFLKNASSISSVDYEAFTGSVTISKIDTIANIVTGTFYCDVKNGNSEIIKITDGKFEAAIQ